MLLETLRGWKVLERSVTTSCAGAFPGPLAKIGSIFFLNTFTKQLLLSWKDLTEKAPEATGSKSFLADWRPSPLVPGQEPAMPSAQALPCPRRGCALSYTSQGRAENSPVWSQLGALARPWRKPGVGPQHCPSPSPSRSLWGLYRSPNVPLGLL